MKTQSSVPLLAALSAAMILSAGCSTTRVNNNASSTQTQIDLTRANYKMIKAGAEGRSYGFRLLLGIIPITSPNTAAARADLYRNVGESVNGKSVALINTTEDRSTTWLLLFSIPKLVITGDVVEFTPEGSGQVQTVQPTNSQPQ
jgi:Family of unknown function (DUF6567)